jgi:hypothetical protein
MIKVTYAAVAAKTSIFLALVANIKTSEDTCADWAISQPADKPDC